MKQALEPLAAIPGVRVAMLVTTDGVPITALGDRRAARKAQDEEPYEGAERRQRDRGVGASEDLTAWAALGAGWVADLTRALAPLGCKTPDHLALVAARGTLLVQSAPGALLVVILRTGMSAEELRVPMNAAVARLERHLREIDSKAADRGALESAPSILPARSEPREEGEVPTGGGNWVSTSGSVNPEVSGE